jgi:hypothetical protein
MWAISPGFISGNASPLSPTLPRRQGHNHMETKARRISGNTLIVLSSLALLGSASAKLAHVPAVLSQMSAAGLAGDRLIFVAVLEVLSAIAFLIPATRSIGLLLISSFLGGAIATHLQHGQSIIPPSMVLMLAWFAAWLRHPFILWSFRGGASEGSGEPRAQSSILGTST